MFKTVLTLIVLSLNLQAAQSAATDPLNLLFFGAFGMIVVYNFSHYLFNRDKSYADYALFHLLVFIIMLFYTGTLDETMLEFSMHGVPVGFFLMAVMALLSFSKNFLGLSVLHPSAEKYYRYTQFGLMGFFALTILPVGGTPLIGAAIIYIVAVLAVLLGVALYLALVKKEVAAQFYLSAFTMLLISVTAGLLGYFNLFSSQEDLHALIETGLLIEAGIFSFALSYRYNQMTLTLRQNELLFKELSHRVQNNLQSIISILTLQKNRLEEAEAKNYLQETIERIGAIALIHKRLQKSNLPGEVEMQSYLEALVLAYKTLHGEVTFKLECDETLHLNIAELTPLALILNELITNSLKHAFMETPSPRITIALKADDSGYLLQYEDNGSGYLSTKRSLGTLLIENLSTRQLKGHYSVDVDNGYRYKLRFAQG